MKEGSTYRPDIDGLRAVAVLAVLFVHVGFGGFSGGYVGVDVFFVISGYLITGLIYAEMARGKFSLKAWYLRRIRRFAPALLVMSVPVAACAFALLYAEAMRSFASSLSLQFVSLQNDFFLVDGEYFRGAVQKPLLQTVNARNCRALPDYDFCSSSTCPHLADSTRSRPTSAIRSGPPFAEVPVAEYEPRPSKARALFASIVRAHAGATAAVEIVDPGVALCDGTSGLRGKDGQPWTATRRTPPWAARTRRRATSYRSSARRLRAPLPPPLTWTR